MDGAPGLSISEPSASWQPRLGGSSWKRVPHVELQKGGLPGTAFYLPLQ